MTHPRRQPGEGELIESIRKISSGDPLRRRGLVLSIGDDAAAFRVRPSYLTLISSDALVEGVHFRLNYFSPEDLGWKSLAVNLSDIAAMGGTPLYVTTSIALPKGIPVRFVDKFYSGFMKLARQHQVSLIGGDTCSSPQGIFLDVTIIGEVQPKKLVTRSGARPADGVYVTGELGGSAMGMEQLARSPRKQRADSLTRRHLRPQPRCAIGRFLADSRLASAMIDVSDGLSTDLNHLCQASQTGAMIYGTRIPLPKLPASKLARLSHDPLHYALNGGEDYELLFTVPARHRKKVPRTIHGVPVHEIGHITSEVGACWLWQDENKTKLSSSGFDHFAGAAKP